MDKYKLFFDKIGLIEEKDFDTFIDCAEFSLIFPTKTTDKIELSIKVKKIFPIEFFRKIIDAIGKVEKEMKISFLKPISGYSVEHLEQYCLFFCEKQSQPNIILTNLFKRNSITMNDEGLISIHYFSGIELSELKLFKNELITFLRNASFAFEELDFILDKDRQKLELYKEKRKEELLKKSSEKDKVFKYKNVEIENEITTKTITKLCDVENGMRSLVVVGEIFSLSTTRTRTNLTIYTFGISDYTNSLTIKVFSGANSYQNLPDGYLQQFKPGMWIKAKIEVTNDKYQNNELSGMIKKIVAIPKPDELIRKDGNPTPRVELICRTKMTAFDGLTPIEQLITRVKDYKHAAASIVDRYNVQSYPEAFKFGKKYNVKINYGVEVDALPKEIKIATNPINADLTSSTIVVFDLETTGLFNEYDEIIEFGGIKYKDGKIIEQLQFFIKPKISIPNHITQITKITNDMVKDAESINTALTKIVKWIGNDILIAHNGINFDMRFLNKKLEQNNFPLLKNPLIDTMQLSRAINTDMWQHSLGALARKFKIAYDENVVHRADADAEILSHVWNNLLSHLKTMKINNLIDLNSLQNSSLYSANFGNHICIYAKNQNAIKDIYKIVSYSYTKDLYKNPRVFYEELNENRKNLILINNPYEGDVWDSAINGTNEQLEKVIKYYDFIAVAPVKNFMHEIDRKNITEANTEKTILKIINFASKLNKKVVVVSDSYYLDPCQQAIHSIFVNSKILNGRNHRLYRYNSTNKVLPLLSYRTTDEMLREFDFLNDPQLISEIVVENPLYVSNLIDKNIQPIKTGLFTPKIPDVEQKLERVVYSTAHKLYGEVLPEKIEIRIKNELKAIITNGYAVIYWISHLLVEQSLNDGYLVGSRGSVGSSLVAFFANISEVNPLPPHYICDNCKYSDFTTNVYDGFDLDIKECPKCHKNMHGDGHNIPFETFLGFAGEKIPDIDLNFSGFYQAKAHNFIKKMFGDNHTFRAGTISTIAEKTAYGYVKNYYESCRPNEVMRTAEINRLVTQCVDIKRTTGQHPGGIIIVPNEFEIFDFSPYNYPADDKNSEWYTTHFAFENIHDNLLKFDILGHDDPTSLKMLEQLTHIDPKTIPFKDEKVMALFNSLDSINLLPPEVMGNLIAASGLPEFGTEFVKKMLYATKPQSFADLIRISGLSHGTDVWINNAVDLISKANMKLSEVIACRDDIMLYLISMGVDSKVAFAVMEDVRKGKMIKPEHQEILIKNQIPSWYIDSCNKIKYLFPKAHATAYVLMAWRIAWYKVYYPLEFYASYFSIHAFAFDTITISSGKETIEIKVADIRARLNSPILKRDVKQKEKDMLTVYEVAVETYARGFKVGNIDLAKSHPTDFTIENGILIPPFSVIDGLGTIGAESIVKARTERIFTSKEDFLKRVKISKTIYQWLLNAGVLDYLEEDNQMNLFS